MIWQHLNSKPRPDLKNLSFGYGKILPILVLVEFGEPVLGLILENTVNMDNI